LVVDQVRSKRQHICRHYFQLGEEISADHHKGAVALEAPGFSGELDSVASKTQKLSLVKRQDKPRHGLIFTHYRKKVNRWTVTYRTKGADVDHLATFALDAE